MCCNKLLKWHEELDTFMSMIQKVLEQCIDKKHIELK